MYKVYVMYANYLRFIFIKLLYNMFWHKKEADTLPTSPNEK